MFLLEICLFFGIAISAIESVVHKEKDVFARNSVYVFSSIVDLYSSIRPITRESLSLPTHNHSFKKNVVYVVTCYLFCYSVYVLRFF